MCEESYASQLNKIAKQVQQQLIDLQLYARQNPPQTLEEAEHLEKMLAISTFQDAVIRIEIGRRKQATTRLSD